jgi:hypothetical protein
VGAGRLKKPAPPPSFFDFKPTVMTGAVRRDLEVLRMRTFINPKRHYKGSDHKWDPKQFQIGKVIVPAQEYYTSGHSKKQLKRGAMDSLKSDVSMMPYLKRKFLEVQDKAQSGGKKDYKKKMKMRRPKWAKT